MKLLTLIFSLGVLFAAFNFIWFFIEFFLKSVRGLRPATLFETYLVKAIKYFFLANVTFGFCIDISPIDPSYILDWQRLMAGGVILLTYLLGKFQKKQERLQFFGGFNMPKLNQVYSFPLEISLLVLVTLEYIGFYFFPYLSENLLAKWFEGSIKSLENAFLLGFIFKIIGFFFLIGMFVKLLNTINVVLSGKPLFVTMSSFTQGQGQQPTTNSDEQFTDYEEVPDEQLNEPKD
jgi:hypothetical protein